MLRLEAIQSSVRGRVCKVVLGREERGEGVTGGAEELGCKRVCGGGRRFEDWKHAKGWASILGLC